ncbi:MAG: dethiobiotin synthase [Candidatus Omnitrophota bacterium]|nr:dethiobiotin synthase [Candidatus Omnitrophota bacterium]
MRKGVFISATGTGIGKTLISSCIIRLLRLKKIDCGVMKPVQCGGDDAQRLIRRAGVNDPIGLVSPFYSKYPYAPLVAFKKEGINFNAGIVISSFKALSKRHKFMVVEGAGGMLVPLANNYFIADLVLDLKLPLIIIASTALGTINHTLLTVESAKKRKIKILGIIFNNLSLKAGVAEKINPEVIQRICRLPILGNIPYIQPCINNKNILKLGIDLGRILHE